MKLRLLERERWPIPLIQLGNAIHKAQDEDVQALFNGASDDVKNHYIFLNYNDEYMAYSLMVFVEA